MLPSSSGVSDQKKLQMLWFETAQRLHRPLAHNGLYCIAISRFGNYDVRPRRDAVRHIARTFTLVVRDRPIAIEIQPVGQLALLLHIEQRHRWINDAALQ